MIEQVSEVLFESEENTVESLDLRGNPSLWNESTIAFLLQTLEKQQILKILDLRDQELSHDQALRIINASKHIAKVSLQQEADP